MTGGRLPIYLATGASLGVVIAYLLAGGASYQPLEPADPCDPRPLEVLAERGVFEGIALSALDGAACELQVSREELLAAFADEQSLAAFADEQEVTEERIVEAVRAGLVRAVDDAEREGLISPLVATIARGIAERAPVAAVIELFRALPGDVSVIDLLQGLQDLELELSDIPDLSTENLEELRDEIEQLLPETLPELVPEDLEQDLRDLFGDGFDPGSLPPLPDGLQELLPQGEELEGLLRPPDGG